MEEIKRYDLRSYAFCGGHGDELVIDSEGDYVDYEDHKAVVETMQEEIVSYATTISDTTETIIKMHNKIDELEKELNSYVILFKPYQPCNHRGCLSHLSHPCEGCGRIGGEGFVYAKGIK